MKIQSALLSGAGNTFHLFYNIESPDSELAKKVCEKFPADGVVFLRAPGNNEAFYKWDFFNKDGSTAEMCGNATRCVGYYIENILKSKNENLELMTEPGIIKIDIIGQNKYRIHMTQATVLSHSKYFYCNTGVPHVVIIINQDEKYSDHFASSKKIRDSQDFFPHGTNVTLLQFTSQKNTVKAITYERGVEGFTLACGTGAVAAGLFMNEKHQQNKTNVEMPGGTLNIDMTNYNEPLMTGSVEHLKDCIYELNT